MGQSTGCSLTRLGEAVEALVGSLLMFLSFFFIGEEAAQCTSSILQEKQRELSLLKLSNSLFLCTLEWSMTFGCGVSLVYSEPREWKTFYI